MTVNSPVGERGRGRLSSLCWLWLAAQASSCSVIGCWRSSIWDVESQQRFNDVSEERLTRRAGRENKQTLLPAAVMNTAVCSGGGLYKPLSACWGAECILSMHPVSCSSAVLVHITLFRQNETWHVNNTTLNGPPKHADTPKEAEDANTTLCWGAELWRRDSGDCRCRQVESEPAGCFFFGILNGDAMLTTEQINSDQTSERKHWKLLQQSHLYGSALHSLDKKKFDNLSQDQDLVIMRKSINGTVNTYSISFQFRLGFPPEQSNKTTWDACAVLTYTNINNILIFKKHQYFPVSQTEKVVIAAQLW